MAVIIVALFIAPVREVITGTVNNMSDNYTNASLIKLILTYWPVAFAIIILIILVIVLTRPR